MITLFRGRTKDELVKRWMIMMSRKNATDVQMHCRRPMKLLGYPSRQDVWTKEKVVGKPAQNVQHMLIQ